MGIIFYDDDNWSVVGLILPSHVSMSEEIGIDIKYKVELNSQNDTVSRQIKEYIHNKNQLLTMNTARNINGKLVGDYTCYADVYGRKIKALVTLSANNDVNTNFHYNGMWQKDANTFSIDIEEVV